MLFTHKHAYTDIVINYSEAQKRKVTATPPLVRKDDSLKPKFIYNFSAVQNYLRFANLKRVYKK